jgi:hypothetical protein
MSGRPNAMGPILASLVLTWLSSVKPAVAGEPVCLATERQLICTCDLTQLRPLQGAVGMKQIIYTEKRIADHPKHERRKLEEDPIKVVAGVAANRNRAVKQCRKHCRPGGLLPNLGFRLILVSQTIGAVKPVINWLGNPSETAPVQELGEPPTYLQNCAKFVGSHQASVLDSRASYKTSHRHCRNSLDILKYAMRRTSIRYLALLASTLKQAIRAKRCTSSTSSSRVRGGRLRHLPNSSSLRTRSSCSSTDVYPSGHRIEAP